MATIGGSITEISYNHPTLGTGYFFPKEGEDATIDTGGLRSNDDDGGVDGSGKIIVEMNRVRWSVEVSCANDMNDRRDHEKAVALAGSTADADWTFTHINGTVYAGKGRPVGDLKAAAKSATFGLKVAGGNILKQI